ncbi:hypothetical protein HYQ46_001487 [Verticillium longisporum]|nr:hypothetical protein HYQ44_002222 [Verticillium longisporum]KAG7149592.1 hypothetical protein HYQ46_001487 [Verticillium longisporum]
MEGRSGEKKREGKVRDGRDSMAGIKAPASMRARQWTKTIRHLRAPLQRASLGCVWRLGRGEREEAVDGQSWDQPCMVKGGLRGLFEPSKKGVETEFASAVSGIVWTRYDGGRVKLRDTTGVEAEIKARSDIRSMVTRAESKDPTYLPAR